MTPASSTVLVGAQEPWPLSSVWANRPAEAQACPIRVSLGVLGRKWTLVVLRDIAFRPESSFGQILGRTKGLTPRVLSLRLQELRREELIEKVADARDERRSHYRLTAKGRDIVPVLTALVAFGIRHYASEVFTDARPRTLDECFPGRAAELLGDLYGFSLRSARSRGPGRRRPSDRRETPGSPWDPRSP